jgi:hypothetical protein
MPRISPADIPAALSFIKGAGHLVVDLLTRFGEFNEDYQDLDEYTSWPWTAPGMDDVEGTVGAVNGYLQFMESFVELCGCEAGMPIADAVCAIDGIRVDTVSNADDVQGIASILDTLLEALDSLNSSEDPF